MPGFKNLKRSRRGDDSDADSDVETTKNASVTKKSKTGATGQDSGKDADGNSYWGLSGKRRVTISDFKGAKYVNIREYWTDNSGEMKPGKKGISLPIDQYNALLLAIPAINVELKAAGLEVASGINATPALPTTSAKEKKESKSKKANIEATSDEEEKDEEDEASD